MKSLFMLKRLAYMFFSVLLIFLIASCLSSSVDESSSWNISKDGSDVVRKNKNAAAPKKKTKPEPKEEPVQKVEPEKKSVVPEEKKIYSILFSANGGIGSMGARRYAEGTRLELASNVFSRPGYRFVEWNTGADGNGVRYADGARITVSGDLTLYAQWQVIGESDFVEVEGMTVRGEIGGSRIFVRGRTVTIDTFWMCNHEVTQGEYETYCCYGGRRPSDEDGSGSDIPVYYTNWYDAIVYCNMRSRAEGREAVYSLNGETNPEKWQGIVSKTENGKTKYCGPTSNNAAWDKIRMNNGADGYRLPTEAEWEYAARGGKAGMRDAFAYSGANELGAVGWFEDNSGGKAHKIRTKMKNQLGIYDMSGNVWEWCWDWYATVSAGTARTGAAFATNRVERGGDWFNEKLYCAVSYRLEDEQSGRDAGDGFRLVCNTMSATGALKR